MALKFSALFPLFSPNPTSPCARPACSPTDVRFSRWNNANAEPFLRRQREQKEIEDEIRRHRRYQSVLKIAEDAADDAADTAAAASFKSRGTPSSPSSPSIPGKASKYSKPPSADKPRHPAFRPSSRPWRSARLPPEPDEESGVSVGEKGVTYKIKDAPFEFQYSYTETPKVKPVALREPLFLPFGPSTMPRPWTGRAPLPPSKKKLPEFDSFKPPPPGKKGVKTVQSPGPFVAGSGPKYHAASREEILGEPLTDEEVKELVRGCLKTKRQLNMGRDGLTHNMLDNIHAHWKRRRVCKIKCKGVCTVDMDNVREQLEEKTGGKIIYSKGGVIFLFRGRNYNYMTRPRFPLMLWKPVSPVYPRLVQRVPEGLTLEEATKMRKNGRQLPPICKLGKNGVYCNLVNQVKEAFEACELVRINCKGLNKSDCRKIGAKLKDLVPCVLLSFEYEHILIWRGKDWISSFPSLKSDQNEVEKNFSVDEETTSSTTSSSTNDQVTIDLKAGEYSHKEFRTETPKNDMYLDEYAAEGFRDILDLEENNQPLMLSSAVSSNNSEMSSSSLVGHQENPAIFYKETPTSGSGDQTEELTYQFPGQNKSSEEDVNVVNEIPYQQNSNKFDNDRRFREEVSSESNSVPNIYLEDKSPEGSDTQISPPSHVSSTKLELNSGTMIVDDSSGNIGLEIEAQDVIPDLNTTSSSLYLEGVMLLLNEAVENGSAVILDDSSLDPDIVFQNSVALSKTAPPGPRFQHKLRKVTVTSPSEETDGIKEPEVEADAFSASDKRTNGRKKSGMRRNNLPEILPDVVPRGSLRVDELAKLLA